MKNNFSNFKNSDKKFGLLFSFIFFIIFIYLYYTHKNVSFAFLSLAITVLLFMISILKSNLLSPLNLLWMKLALLLSRIVNPIIIGIIFICMFIPIALLMKIMNRDELSLKEKSCNSFWKYREKQELDKNSFSNQF